MKILADESVNFVIVQRLRADGHDVASIAETSRSVPDPVVLAAAVESQVILLTADKDFGELVYRLNSQHCGVVLTRIFHLSNDAQADVVSTAFRDHESKFRGAFTVLSPGKMRVRKNLSPDA